MHRTLFRIRSAFSRPSVNARLVDGIIPFAQHFHSKGAAEAVVLTLYKKSAASQTASSIVPSTDDFVLLAKKKPEAKFLGGQFGLIGGIVEKGDMVRADCGLDVYRNALAREAFEEAGLAPSDYASSYCSSFFDRATRFNVHCFSGFLLSDPQKTVQAQHLAHANLRPTNSEHDNFSWMPVKRVFSSRQVSKIAKRAVDLTLSD